MTIVHHFETDAFSNGQIDSKLWLCRELEKLLLEQPDLLGKKLRSGEKNPVIWILGGWYGVLSLLLLSRQRVQIGKIRSFDLEEDSTRMADQINNNWLMKDWTFKAYTGDANWLNYVEETKYGPAPDIVINTSSEHFTSTGWYERIPAGTMVAVQSNDMVHHEHIFLHQSLSQHKQQFPMGERLYEGKLGFKYPDWSFTRFMTIGIK